MAVKKKTRRKKVVSKKTVKKSTRKKAAAKKSTRKKRSKLRATSKQKIIYIHGIGDHPPKESIKREWDLALFGREMGVQTEMAYWSDILHKKKTISRASTGRNINVDSLLIEAGIDPDNEAARALSRALLSEMGVSTGSNFGAKVLPLPAFLRKPIARAFLKAFIKDTAAYFFTKGARKKITQRLKTVLSKNKTEPVIIIAHSQGTIVTLEVLAELAKKSNVNVSHLITIGSPLGIQEVQDFLNCELDVPVGVDSWKNFADPLDPVALDKGIGNDFNPDNFIQDDIILNTNSRRLKGFNPHSAVGYLAHPKIRNYVCDAARIDRHARFLIARDVAADMAIEARHSVLIEILEPGYYAVGESYKDMQEHEAKVEGGQVSLSARIERAAEKIKNIVGKANLKDARIDPLRRFVSARLTPAELNLIAHKHCELRIYAVWKSTGKKALINRSSRVIQADAARASYAAAGKGINWAVLDTGIREDHPHFTIKDSKSGRSINLIRNVWDCTKPGRPKLIENDKDRHGHGTHVAGIIAGSSEDGEMQGVASQATLEIYKVLNNRGEGEDAWIIKALDHIAEVNENNSDISIHGINLSLGGPYDSTVYGCGFSPICVELRRQWRAGVLVCVASGNEGQLEISTPNGEVELNRPMSIGDPANLEDCIAVGSVNADLPNLYGVSSFSSRGPTSDGRVKPDVVAPGERIQSCNSRYSVNGNNLYRSDSGTSMAAPHVSGVLAAFLSVRKEYRGRPDEVKEILLKTCTDIERDKYIQGKGVPNLMKMLLET